MRWTSGFYSAHGGVLHCFNTPLKHKGLLSICWWLPGCWWGGSPALLSDHLVLLLAPRHQSVIVAIGRGGAGIAEGLYDTVWKNYSIYFKLAAVLNRAGREVPRALLQSSSGSVARKPAEGEQNKPFCFVWLSLPIQPCKHFSPLMFGSTRVSFPTSQLQVLFLGRELVTILCNGVPLLL